MKAVGLIDPNADTKQKKEKAVNGSAKTKNLIEEMENIVPITPKTNGS